MSFNALPTCGSFRYVGNAAVMGVTLENVEIETERGPSGFARVFREVL
jgi:hypothetical protein